MASSVQKLAYDRAWRKRHRERLNAYSRIWRKAHPDRAKHYHIKHAYGLSPEQWGELFSLQGQKCASCGTSSSGHKHGWQIDHNHTTGLVRGILCCTCNIALHVIEQPVLVKNLQKYLEERS